MVRRAWGPLLMGLMVACAGDDPGEEAEQQESEQQQQVAAGCDALFIPADSILVLAAAGGFSTDPARVDTNQLKPNGPRAAIALASTYDVEDSTDTAFVVGKIKALESIAYARFNLAAADSVYVWVQRCQGADKVFFIASNATVGARRPPWRGHAHVTGTREVGLRDTTVSSTVDSLRGEFGLDSAYVDSLPRDSGDSTRASALVTAICAQCKAGWCNGV